MRKRKFKKSINSANKTTKTNLKNVLNNINVVQANFTEVKKFFEDMEVHDITNKVIILRIKPAEMNFLDSLQNTIYAINEVLKKNNSTFLILPDVEHIDSVSIEDIDNVIKDLESLKNKKENEDNEEK